MITISTIWTIGLLIGGMSVIDSLQAPENKQRRQIHRFVIAGFFVDLAIVDPEIPGRYLLGIECDGAAYHSARSARDRDRLRQQVLEDHGWNIHRVWSTDWFRNPVAEMTRVCEAIEAAGKAVTTAPTRIMASCNVNGNQPPIAVSATSSVP